MIDAIRITFPVQEPEKLIARLDNVIQLLDYNRGERRIQGQIKNLKVVVNLSNKLVLITNSIHKFYKAGVNHEAFTYTEFIKAIDELAFCLGLPPKILLASDLTKFEFGANIITQNEPSTYLQKIKYFKRVHFRPLKYPPYNFEQITVNTTRFVVKLYDKTTQHNLNSKGLFDRTGNKIVRLELVRWARARALINIRRLEDLAKPETFKLLSSLLVDYLNSFGFESSYDMKPVSLKNNDRKAVSSLNAFMVMALESKSITEIQQVQKSLGLPEKTIQNNTTTLNRILRLKKDSSEKHELVSGLRETLNSICDWKK